MTYRQNYEKWMTGSYVDQNTKEELQKIAGDEKEIEARFTSMMEFGTAGLRGHIAPGLACMNEYTVRYATQGLSDLIVREGEEAMERGVVIAFDSRHKSPEFAREAACVLAANGVRVYLFDAIRPTPELSFAIRYLNTISGINITASHNPKNYNGYKAYWEDGAQLSPDHAEIVSKAIASKDIFADVKTMPFYEAQDRGLVTLIGQKADEAYLDAVYNESVGEKSVRKFADSFTVVYTPFHGAGYRHVPAILKRIGVKHLICVPEQMKPDGDFPTVKVPNPEVTEGFALAVELAEKADADIIIGTDPDCDRLGVVYRDEKGDFVPLSGNQIGVMLLDYVVKGLLRNHAMPARPITVKSIVTTRMVEAIAEKYHIECRSVLTGFKFIGEQIKDIEENNSGAFIFGYEESFGYLKGTYCRDKDAVVSSMLLCEMVCYYKEKGMTLSQGLASLYDEYGWFDERVVSVVMEGLSGLAEMKACMEKLRSNPPERVGGLEVVGRRDYREGYILDYQTGQKTKTGLAKSDVLFYELADGSSFVVRPSGTEPKIKCYLMARGDSKEELTAKLDAMDESRKVLLSV